MKKSITARMNQVGRIHASRGSTELATTVALYRVAMTAHAQIAMNRIPLFKGSGPRRGVLNALRSNSRVLERALVKDRKTATKVAFKDLKQRIILSLGRPRAYKFFAEYEKSLAVEIIANRSRN